MLTSCSITALNITDFHSIGQHACQSEWYALWILLAVHSDFETVAKVDVHDLAGDPVEHKIGRMAISQTEDIADHGHNCERSGVICAPIKPSLRALALQPQDPVKVLACCVIKSVSKDLYLLHQGETIIVWRHLQHDAVLNVE